MMSYKVPNKIRIDIVVVLYCIILVAGLLSSHNISSYNYLILGITVACFTIIFNLEKMYFGLAVSLLCSILILLQTNTDILFGILDLSTVILLLQIIKVATKNVSNISTSLKFFCIVSFIYILLYLGFSFSSSLYVHENGRYIGLFGSTNVSSSIILFLVIFLSEYNTKMKIFNSIFFISLLFLLYIYVFYISKTLSLLFAIPYFIYQYYKLLNNKKAFFFLIILVGIFFIYLLNNNRLSFGYDKKLSYNTRMMIYSMFYEKLVNSYFIIPHGFRSSTDLIQLYTANENYSPHNDFLKYLYDWGIFFIILFIYFIYKIRYLFSSYKGFLIMLIFFSTALHNMLFSVYTLIPFLFILLLYRYK